jgi:hypothetical protein
MMLKNFLIFLSSILLIYASPLPPLAGSSILAAKPPLNVKVMDTPNDKGESITLIFERNQEDTLAMVRLCSPSSIEYEIWRSAEEENNFQLVGKILSSDTLFIDSKAKDGVNYFYFIKGTGENDTLISAVFGPVVSKGQWFNPKQTKVLFAVLICFSFILGFILYGKRGKKLYIRPIAGLGAIDDAIGRATEMGKPILYSSGLGKMDRVATMASMNILASVAEKTAEYNTPLIFPNYDPVVMTTAQEVVKEGYSKAGHPEAYKPDNIFFVTQSQFGYAAAVDGIMTRQLPATNLFLGTFEAEALILAETGNSIGAIQIAGTDSTIQLSFFIVACDYTLIGEELFVASGYLTRDPQILGSIKGQDWLKAIIVLLILIGGIVGVLGFSNFIKLFNIG